MTNYQNSSDLYIEVTNKAFKLSPNIVSKQPYLSDKWKTEKVFRVHLFLSGIYLLFDLHKNPHYQLPTKMRRIFDNDAKEKHTVVTDITTDTFEVPKSIFHYTNKSQLYQKHVQPHLNKFKLNNIIDLLDKKAICSRGNIAYNYGWHTMNFNFQGKINIPGHSKISALDQDTMKLMTKLTHLAFSTQVEPIPFATNPSCTQEFANELFLLNKTKKTPIPPKSTTFLNLSPTQ